jgi:hypothetical protein
MARRRSRRWAAAGCGAGHGRQRRADRSAGPLRHLTAVDLDATNGVVHVIDDIILPAVD